MTDRYRVAGSTLLLMAVSASFSLAGCLLDRSGRGLNEGDGGVPGDAGPVDAGRDAGRDAGGEPCVPTPELCDGEDNDCNPATPDGAADPMLGADCESAGDEDECEDDALECVAGGLACADEAPPLPEVCGGGDEDCDGIVDEAGTSWYLDGDGDTYGSGAAVVACTAPANHVDRAGDCDDASAAISPGAVETCNGRDEDCDTMPDDGACPCPVVSNVHGVYMVCTATPLNWSSASAACQAVGYDPLKIDGAAENAGLVALIPTAGDYWTGLLATGAWLWSDASTPTYFNWASGEGVIGGGDSCGAISMPSGQWRDLNCAVPMVYICEHPG